MRYSLDDTIVAIASPPGGGIRGIIRMAGPGVGECLSRCFIPYRQVPEGWAFLVGQRPWEPGSTGLRDRTSGEAPSAEGETRSTMPSEQKEAAISETPQAGGGAFSPSPLPSPTGGEGRTTKGASPTRGEGRTIKGASATRGEGTKVGLSAGAETVPFSEWLAGLRRPVVLPGELRWEGFSAGLPSALYYWPGPGSYTGGPQAEIHTLGCGPLLEAAIRTFCQAGARLAEPGEFTLRAFLSGRMDLTQAEAVVGVVDAADGQQLAVALEQLAGGLARPLQEIRNQLFEFLVHLEAGLDFPEEDLPFLPRQHLADQLRQMQGQLRRLAEQLQTRRIGTEAMTVVLVGRPNAGKSSLFNALLGQEQAMVSPWPGTTRDYLEGQLDLEGLRCRLVDTAGLDWVEVSATPSEKLEAAGGRAADGLGGSVSAALTPGQSAANRIGPGDAETTSGILQRPISIEAAAQQMTARQIQQADLLLWCVDASQPMDAQEWIELLRWSRQARLVVLTKADLPIRIDLAQGTTWCGDRPILTSSRTGQGLQELRRRMREALESLVRTGGHAVWATVLRSAESIRLAREAIDRALELTGRGCPEELVAAELRLALDEIGKVSGAIYTEDLLERIFSRFCIGK